MIFYLLLDFFLLEGKFKTNETIYNDRKAIGALKCVVCVRKKYKFLVYFSEHGHYFAVPVMMKRSIFLVFKIIPIRYLLTIFLNRYQIDTN